MEYSVRIIKYGETEFVMTGLSEKSAIKIATKASIENANHKDCQIFIDWFRMNYGQHGYLNPGGDHAIIGKTW